MSLSAFRRELLANRLYRVPQFASRACHEFMHRLFDHLLVGAGIHDLRLQRGCSLDHAGNDFGFAAACASFNTCSSVVLFSSKTIPSACATAVRLANVVCSPPSRNILWMVGSETPLRRASSRQLIRRALRRRNNFAAISDFGRIVAAIIPSTTRIVWARLVPKDLPL